ncbi:hypothetical protein CRE_28090 [Caenorhabditis remanei]|uniref:Uncharacterized protein n=2 Tax=Caenorhabditis remanei TaxID=31234 RepID=E3LM86_CAERE|nr:hypothetical protein CRE_28090 [Caenorhabditis remanei]
MEGVGTSTITRSTEDVPDIINSDQLLNNEEENVSIYSPYIDNNDNDGTIDREFIHVELISNCQEESEIQLEDSDNNCNVPEYNAEMSNTLSGLTRSLQPNIIMEEESNENIRSVDTLI